MALNGNMCDALWLQLDSTLNCHTLHLLLRCCLIFKFCTKQGGVAIDISVKRVDLHFKWCCWFNSKARHRSLSFCWNQLLQEPCVFLSSYRHSALQEPQRCLNQCNNWRFNGRDGKIGLWRLGAEGAAIDSYNFGGMSPTLIGCGPDSWTGVRDRHFS